MRTSRASSVGSKIRPQNVEILNQERCPRRAAKNLAKDVYKLEKESQNAFYSSAATWVMLAPSSKKKDKS